MSEADTLKVSKVAGAEPLSLPLLLTQQAKQSTLCDVHGPTFTSILVPTFSVCATDRQTWSGASIMAILASATKLRDQILFASVHLQ